MWTVDRLGQWRNAQYGTAPAMAWPTPKAPQQSAQAVAPNRRATEGPAQLRPATAVSAATTLVVCKSTGYGSSRQRSTSLGTAANAAPNANSSNGSGANVPVQRKPLCPLNTSQIVVAAPTGPVKDAAFEKIVPVVKPAAPAVIKAVVPPPPPPQQQQPQQQAPVVPVAQPTSTTTAAASAAPVVAQPQQPMSQQTTRHQSPVTTPAATAACSAPPAPAVSSAPVTVTVPVPTVPLPTATPAPKMVPTDAAIPSSTRRASISSAPTPPALPKTLTRSRPSPNPPAAYTPCTMKQWGSLNRAIYRKKCGAIAAAVAHVTGMRESNEDTHVLEHSRRDATAAGGAAWHSVFGVFDGHGGAQCSKFLADTLPAAIRKASPPLADGQLTSLALQLDEEYLNHNPTGGSTAAFAVVTPAPCAAYDVQLCHVGNARAVLIRRGRILHETRDHTPLVQEERERIEKAGGTVVDARLDGRLENSRAFGDAAWKVDASGKRPDPSDTVAVQTARLVAVPTVTRLLCEEGDVLVVACDGLFETADTDAACQRIYQGLLQNKELGTLAAECCEQAVWSGSEDNVTVMLVQFGGPANLGIAEREFVPGPFHPRTKDFCAAYREDVTNAGWTIGKALAKRCQFLRRHEQQCQEKGQAMSSVLQFELKSWLCNGPSLPLDGQEAWNWFEQLAAHWEKQLDASANRH